MDGCTVPSVIGTRNDEGCVEWVVKRSHLRAGINSHTPLLWVEGPMLPKSVTGGAEPTKGTKRISHSTLSTVRRLPGVLRTQKRHGQKKMAIDNQDIPCHWVGFLLWLPSTHDRRRTHLFLASSDLEGYIRLIYRRV